jgi:hypothetical protein
MPHFPTVTGPDFQKALAVQPLECLPYGCATSAGTFGNLDFAEAIAGKEAKVEKYRPEPFVHGMSLVLLWILTHGSLPGDRRRRQSSLNHRQYFTCGDRLASLAARRE